jgi:hypothetical protein
MHLRQMQSDRDPETADIDRVLDLIARNSNFVNLPERRSGTWSNLREHTSPEQLAEMNRWRQKFGLPPA